MAAYALFLLSAGRAACDEGQSHLPEPRIVLFGATVGAIESCLKTPRDQDLALLVAGGEKFGGTAPSLLPIWRRRRCVAGLSRSSCGRECSAPILGPNLGIPGGRVDAALGLPEVTGAFAIAAVLLFDRHCHPARIPAARSSSHSTGTRCCAGGHSRGGAGRKDNDRPGNPRHLTNPPRALRPCLSRRASRLGMASDKRWGWAHCVCVPHFRLSVH